MCLIRAIHYLSLELNSISYAFSLLINGNAKGSFRSGRLGYIIYDILATTVSYTC